MFKFILLSLFVILSLNVSANDARAISASKDAMKGLDCDFDDCSEKPKVIIKERVIVKEVPVQRVVVKEVPVEKVVYKEKIVYKDRPAEPAPVAKPVVNKQAPLQGDRLYDVSFDIPVIGVVGSSIYNKVEYYHIEDEKVISLQPKYRQYIKRQSNIAAWAAMTLKKGKRLFLSSYDTSIPYFKENFTQINFHVEIPAKLIHNDSVVVSLQKKKFRTYNGPGETYSYCRFNDFSPVDSNLQSTVQLHGKNYLDVKCSVLLWNRQNRDDINSEINTESFTFIPEYRVFPPVRKGSKKAVLGTKLKKFIFASEITE